MDHVSKYRKPKKDEEDEEEGGESDTETWDHDRFGEDRKRTRDEVPTHSHLLISIHTRHRTHLPASIVHIVLTLSLHVLILINRAQPSTKKRGQREDHPKRRKTRRGEKGRLQNNARLGRRRRKNEGKRKQRKSKTSTQGRLQSNARQGKTPTRKRRRRKGKEKLKRSCASNYRKGMSRKRRAQGMIMEGE